MQDQTEQQLEDLRQRLKEIRIALDRKHEIAVIEVHNVWAIYGLKPSGSNELHPTIKKARPRDWGNAERWNYERFKFEWIVQTRPVAKHYINHDHCWTDLKPSSYYDKDDEYFYPDLFSAKICKISLPGNEPALCGRDYLDEDDVWDRRWGDRPPYFNQIKEEEYQKIAGD